MWESIKNRLNKKFIFKTIAGTFAIVLFLLFGVPFVQVYADPIFMDGIHNYKDKDKDSVEDNRKESNAITDIVDCKLNPTCYLEKYIYKNGKWVAENSMEFLMNFAVKPYEILDDPKLEKYYNIFSGLSWAFMSLFVVFQFTSILSKNAVGVVEPDELKMLIRRVVFTAFMIGAFPTIFKWLLQINNLIVEKLVLGFKVDKVNSIVDIGSFATGFGWLLLILSIALLILCYQFAVRLAELGVLFVLGPMAIATNINAEFNIFENWWRHLLSVIFTHGVQVLLLVMLLGGLTSIRVGTDDVNMFVEFIGTLGMLGVIIKSPAFIKEWLYSTGTGRGMASVAGTVGKILVRKYVK